MSLRRASAYTRSANRPYTRNSRQKSKAYIKTIPHVKLAKFHIGALKDFEAGKHTHIVRLSCLEDAQVRDNALEACRMYLTKILDEQAIGQYYLAVKVFPHHFQRENKTAAGAGADRISSGMSHSFGMIIARAAMVAKGKDIFLISCTNEKIARIARDTLAKIRAKIPCRTRIIFEKIK